MDALTRKGPTRAASTLEDPEAPSAPEEPPPPTAEEGKDPFIGARVGNCWVVAKLGEGGFGTVYRAIDEDREKPVALKIVKPERANNEEVIRKFLRGAIAAAQIEHPNVVGIYRIGRDEKYRRHYIVMEHLKGRTLQVILEERGPIPFAEVIPWIDQAAEGLHAGHEKSILHRDVKPDNLMIGDDGILKVTDLGLARQMSKDAKTTKVMGTPHFMSPEQFEGKGLDRRSDVYGLGVTLYYLLSKQFPYDGKTSMQIVFSMLTNPPKPLTAWNPAVPPALWEIVDRMMRRVQAERYGSMREVQRDLRAFLAGADGTPA